MLKLKKQRDVPAIVPPRIRKGDMVAVVAGRDSGKRAKVLRVLPSKGRAIVERINVVKKHTRPNPQKNIKGGIAESEAPIQLSNLMVVCPSCDEPGRLKSKVTEEGTIRVCRKS